MKKWIIYPVVIIALCLGITPNVMSQVTSPSEVKRDKQGKFCKAYTRNMVGIRGKKQISLPMKMSKNHKCGLKFNQTVDPKLVFHKITLFKAPKHGRAGVGRKFAVGYVPKKNFVGKDLVVFEVTMRELGSKTKFITYKLKLEVEVVDE